jgi:serine/threonine protein phosphatase PrpC
MGNYQSFAVTATGKSHERIGKECQDASSVLPSKMFLNIKSSRVVVAIADGHGDDNCFRSRKGAEIASLCATNGMRDFLNKYKPSQENSNDEVAETLIRHIISQWQILVEEDYSKKKGGKKSNFSEKELAQATEKYRKMYENGEALNKAYGTTLIAAMATKHYWLGIHIGDGRFTVLYPDGTFAQPVPWDDRCFLNATTSICDDDAAERARYCFFSNEEKEPPVAVFLCSDGVDDNYPVEENEKHLCDLYRKIAVTFVKDGFGPTCKQLNDLAVKFATEGKGDDTTIAGFVDTDRLKSVVQKWK